MGSVLKQYAPDRSVELYGIKVVYIVYSKYLVLKLINLLGGGGLAEDSLARRESEYLVVTRKMLNIIHTV